MLEVDIEQFVESGTFGMLGNTPSRELVIETLGEPDTIGYPDHDNYGNVAFEFCPTAKRLFRIMVAFPHQLNTEQSLDPTRAEVEWPDSRFSFSLGRFLPGLELRDIRGELTGFKYADMVGESPHRILSYSNPENGVDLLFAPETNLAYHSLYCIVAHQTSNNQSTA